MKKVLEDLETCTILLIMLIISKNMGYVKLITCGERQENIIIMERLEYDDFAPLLGSWCELFRPFIESKEMYDIYQKLKQVGIDEKKKEIIVPNNEQVFRAFATTSPHTVKTIWYLMD